MTAGNMPHFTCPIVPVVTIERPETAVPLAKALQDAGLTTLEITFRTKHAMTAIRRIKEACPNLQIGAGTITEAAQIEQALSAGSDFLVSPGTSDRLFDLFDGLDILVLPGVATPSEALTARQRGYKVQKFFPAAANGGVAALQALAAPLPEICFMPTGGIYRENMNDYLTLTNVVAIGGSWMIDTIALKAEDWTQIRKYAKHQTRR